MKENQDTLYSPNSKEDEAVKALEEELEDTVARYAQDNLLVVRVRKSFNISTELLSQVFLKDPYYQKMTRDLKMSGNAFFGAAGGWLFPTLSFLTVAFPHCGLFPLWLFSCGVKLSLKHKGSACRVPDTRPDPIIFGNTQSIPDFFSESSGISGIGYFTFIRPYMCL